jgi:DnaJ-class molecular chaperone
MAKLRFTHPALDDQETGEQKIFWLEGKMVVCPECGGTGSHVRRDLDDSKLVEMLEADGDYEGMERYYAGAYDERCRSCEGKNVLLVPNQDALSAEDHERIQDWHDSERESMQIEMQERRAGA